MTVALTPATPNTNQPGESTLGAEGRRTLGELYDQFGAVAYSLAYAITADREQAERVVTLSFAAAWKDHESRGTSTQEFFSALMNAVRANAVVRRARGDTAVPRFDAGRNPNGGSIERAVSFALQELPDAQRNVLALAYFGGLAVADIAAELRAPMSYVKENLQAAMRHLRSVIMQRSNGTVSA